MDLPSAYIRSTLYPEFRRAVMYTESEQLISVGEDEGEEEGDSDVGVTIYEGDEGDKSIPKRFVRLLSSKFSWAILYQ